MCTNTIQGFLFADLKDKVVKLKANMYRYDRKERCDHVIKVKYGNFTSFSTTFVMSGPNLSVSYMLPLIGLEPKTTCVQSFRSSNE